MRKHTKNDQKRKRRESMTKPGRSVDAIRPQGLPVPVSTCRRLPQRCSVLA